MFTYYSLIRFLVFSIKADKCTTPFLLDLLLHSILSHIFCLCAFFIPTHNLCFWNLTISLGFPWFLSLLFLTLISPSLRFFFFSISICHVCVSVPIFFLSSVPRGSHIQRLESFLPHQHFCCSQAVSCCFVMFGGKVPLKCRTASLKRERQVCEHMGDGGSWIAFCVLSKPYEIVHCG